MYAIKHFKSKIKHSGPDPVNVISTNHQRAAAVSVLHCNGILYVHGNHYC